MRLEQIVEPGRPGAFFEGHRQSSTQSRQELQNGGGFGLQDGLHDYLASAIHHRDRDGCLMHVEPNILFTAPFVGGAACAHKLLQKGRPFIMRLQHLTSRQQGVELTSDKNYRQMATNPPLGPAVPTISPNRGLIPVTVTLTALGPTMVLNLPFSYRNARSRSVAFPTITPLLLTPTRSVNKL